MSNEVEIVVVSKDKTDFSTVERKAKESGTKMAAGLKADVEKGLSSVGKDATKVGQTITKEFSTAAEKGLKEIGSKTGHAAREGIKDFGKMLVDDISGAVVGTAKVGGKIGKSLGTGIADGASSVLESTGPGGAVIGAAVIGAIALTAPLIGAVMSAAVIGAAGAGGIVGGILLAAQDRRVLPAFGELGTKIVRRLKVDSAIFVKPLIDSVPIFEKAWDNIEGRLRDVFSESSKYITPLASAFSDIGSNIANGLFDLVDNAGPVINVLIKDFKEWGETIGDSFSILSEDSGEAAEALDILLKGANLFIQMSVGLIDNLSDAFGKMMDAVSWLGEHHLLPKGVAKDFEEWRDKTESATSSVSHLGSTFEESAASANQLTDSLRGIQNELKSETDPIFALVDAQSELAKAQNKVRDAARKSGKGSQEYKDALIEATKASIRMEGATEEAARTFNGKMPASLRATLTAAHFTSGQINTVAAMFRKANADGNKFARTYTATVITTYKSFGSKPNTAIGGIGNKFAKGYASGGVVGHAAEGGVQSNMTLVGEDGPELVNLAPGSQVTPASGTRATLAGMGGGGRVQVELVISGNDQGMLQWLHQKQRSKELQIFATSIV
jgi:hypothetical protein